MYNSTFELAVTDI